MLPARGNYRCHKTVSSFDQEWNKTVLFNFQNLIFLVKHELSLIFSPSQLKFDENRVRYMTLNLNIKNFASQILVVLIITKNDLILNSTPENRL